MSTKKQQTSDGYMNKIPMKTPAKPKLNPNLKIRGETDPEKAMDEYRGRYQKNGNTTWGGAAKLLGDTAVTIGKRIIGQNGD